MKELNTKISVTVIRDKNLRYTLSGGYKYLIKCAHNENGFTYQSKAFKTTKGIKNWMRERGLKVGVRSWCKNTFSIDGNYYDNCIMDEKEFTNLKGELCYVLNNGDYTLGIITNDDGIKVVNFLNPNCKRIVYNYQIISELVA